MSPSCRPTQYIKGRFFTTLYNVATTQDLHQGVYSVSILLINQSAVYFDVERFIEPNLPLAPRLKKTEGNDIHEYLAVNTIEADAWTEVTTKFAQHPRCSECFMSARIIGRRTDDRNLYVVMFIEPDSVLWNEDVDEIFHPFELIKVAYTTTEMNDEEDEEYDNPVNGNYKEIVDTGCSIGPSGNRSACTFGGYIDIDGGVYGLSVCRGTCSATCHGINFEDEPPTLSSPTAI